MKIIKSAHIKEIKNALGSYVNVKETIFEIEKEDVGKIMPNYLGMFYSNYKIKTTDIGRKIQDLETSWCFMP